MSVQNLHRINQRITTILLKRGMVVLCTECKHSVTQSWNTTKVFWQFRGIMLTWISEPWKKYIISVSFTFPSVAGKPTSYSRHVPDDIAHTISVRWQTEGIMILPQKGSGDIREVKFLWRSKAWPEETFLDSGMWWTNTNHNLLVETMNVDSCFNNRCWICSEINFNMLHNNENG